MLDFFKAGYHRRGEPYRSELAVTAAASLANAVYEMGQQVGFVTNGRDAADRIRQEGWDREARTRMAARTTAAMHETRGGLQPVIVETRRGVEQLQRIRESLARVELTDGMPFPQLIAETAGRLPRDATVLALLPDVPVESAIALGNLRRRGMALTVVLVGLEPDKQEKAYGRLIAEGIRDIRPLMDEAGLPHLCRQQMLGPLITAWEGKAPKGARMKARKQPGCGRRCTIWAIRIWARINRSRPPHGTWRVAASTGQVPSGGRDLPSSRYQTLFGNGLSGNSVSLEQSKQGILRHRSRNRVSGGETCVPKQDV